jgi:mannose-1-phosphate guanylyltransferase
MAGGIGSRFWPFSRQAFPKQFLDFFGTGRSLLQMTFERVLPLIPAENIYVVTNADYRDIVLSQLPAINPEHVLCEPARRNTAPCIAYAVGFINGREDNANILVAASDHLITNEQQFLKVIGQGLNFVANHDDILTLGIKPSRYETRYGYIKLAAKQKHDDDIVPVEKFTEKPDLEHAKKFVDSGDYVWNSGMFLFNLKTINAAFREFQPEIYDFYTCEYFGIDDYIENMFPQCPSVSIDYGIMEKARNVSVLPADFGWSDLGTWGSLYELSDKDANGNVTLKCMAQYHNAKDNIVTLADGKLAVIDSLEGYIVAEQGNALLICPKNNEQQIKQFVAQAGEEYQ